MLGISGITSRIAVGDMIQRSKISKIFPTRVSCLIFYKVAPVDTIHHKVVRIRMNMRTFSIVYSYLCVQQMNMFKAEITVCLDNMI